MSSDQIISATTAKLSRRNSTLQTDDNGDNVEEVEKIITAVRVRPVSDSEHASNCQVVMVPDPKEPGMCIIDPVFFSAANKDSSNRKAYEREFRCDYFFWSANKLHDVEFATQQKVFESCAKPLVGHCIAGFNCAILAYGQTGSGKTHTMMGYQSNEEGAGVIPRLCKSLIEDVTTLMTDKQHKISIEVSYYEIYNEKVYDLLSEATEVPCRVREHKLQGAYVEGLTRVVITSYDDVALLLEHGQKHRAVAATLLNSTSSRSHAVFTVHLNQTLPDPLKPTATDGHCSEVQRVSKVCFCVSLLCFYIAVWLCAE